LELEKIDDRIITKSAVLMTMIAVPLIVFAGSILLLQAKAYAAPARPNVFGGSSSAGPSSQCAVETGSVITICNYNVPSTDPQTITAKVTNYGGAGSQEITVANINGVTPSSVALETGKLNQQFR
jgi:hypothetical protein